MENNMTSEQKRENRFQRWLNPMGIDFKSAQAKKAYQDRVNRFIKVIKLEKPDRVPVILPAGSFPLYYSGMTLKEAMFDNERLCQAYRKFMNEFESDTLSGPMVPSGVASEIINSLTVKWPGHGLPDNVSMMQFVEGEYMKEDEYDFFMEDLTDFILRRYLPRSLGALAPFADFPPTPFVLGMANRFLSPTIMPKVRAAYRAIVDYAFTQQAAIAYLREINHTISELIGTDFAALAKKSTC